MTGARRVWGTVKTASHSTVRATIVKLAKVTCVNLADDLHVKRKCNSTSSGKMKWWFVLHDKEDTLKALKRNWENISLQTGWRLEQCTKPVTHANEKH